MGQHTLALSCRSHLITWVMIMRSMLSLSTPLDSKMADMGCEGSRFWEIACETERTKSCLAKEMTEEITLEGKGNEWRAGNPNPM